MKFQQLIPLLLLIFFFNAEASQAQLLNRIKNTAQNAASRAVERKVERAVEKAVERQIERSWTKMFGEQTDAEGYPIAFSKIMEGWDMDVHVEDYYKFQRRAVIEISGTDHKGKAVEPMLFYSYLSKSEPYTAMRIDNDQAEQMTMIFDAKNNATVILMDNKGEKSSIAYSVDWEAIEIPEENITSDESPSSADFKKTGKTKSILGHLCEEYETEDEEGIGHIWITKEEVEGITNFWGNNSPLFKQKMKTQSPKMVGLPQGSMLEMHYASKKDKTVSLFVMKELDNESINNFDMKDYPNMMKGSDL